MKDDKLLIEILKNQVKPALGCTEPGAVAYAVARAKELLNDEVKKLEIKVDKNVLKNGMGVGIPGTNEKGIIFAAALSLVIGKSKYQLEVLKDVTDESIKAAIKIIDSKIIRLSLDEKADNLYINVEAFGENDRACVIIKNSHSNIVFESKNDVILYNCDVSQTKHTEENNSHNKDIKYKIKDFSFDDLIDFANSTPLENLAFIQDGIDMNMRIANVGINEDLGKGIGKCFYGKAYDIFSKAKAYTAAASEARMSGYLLPVMSSAGSGNHGLVTIIPIAVIGSGMNIPKEKIIRSVTLSHLVTIFVKAYLGTLSPVCGCGVAAGVGSAAGLTYMMGGNKEQIKGSINNMVAGISGMICDGAKLGCSYKVSVAVDAAIDASNMALQNIYIPSDNGILGETAEKTIMNLAKVSIDGMSNTDSTILDVMLQKCV
ncbi:L-cysteine desulfidase family protein [Lutispora thermophila]|uniref:UPF0597 protein SAMN02745176_02583 n=1 Tax=Lutispora thermophila DSM 19022 TaxID=1122184 RepID=A0A1M6H0C3_9FIRM|nr:L-serine ammonia-lyase, iron-sulfur-dependent, subunit alpha [Lutispora thermophila]SHJ15620.1 L-cysteine desulfidase [Lutispora thermophila DSM 19022]